MANYLYVDIESFNAGLEYSMAPEKFMRLAQLAWNDEDVILTRDYDFVLKQIRAADYVVAHFGIAFDLSVLFGPDSLESLEMVLAGKVIDTFVIASLVTPAPYTYTNREGHTFFDAAKPEQAMKWLSLDNLCFQFGIPGKMGNLKELAKKYNPPKTLIHDLDFSLIPLDDPEFLGYAEQDVIALRGLWKYLQARIKEDGYSGEYIWRELRITGINAQISRNGILVDQALAQKRIDELAVERDRVMKWLVEEHEFPTVGKSPWASAKGKEVILDVLANYGITEKTNPDWPRTPKGALTLGGSELIDLTEGTEAEEFGRAMATLKGQRSLAQLALDSMHPDGRVHPSIATLQRSGRTSVQRPGLTIWGARGGGEVEKAYFVADPGCKMVAMDFGAADARAVAAVSGDPEFAKRFEPGVDAHDLTGVIFFGEEAYYADRERNRPLAKQGGHSMAYRVGGKKLAAGLGVTVDEAKGFISAYKRAYPWVALWQDKITEEGERLGYVTNSWGRRMMVDEGRSFTQSSALIGQSTTRECLFDGLLRIAKERIDVIRWVKATIHDEVLWSIPETELGWAVDWIHERMEQVFDPKTGVSQPIEFVMSVGTPGDSWMTATH